MACKCTRCEHPFSSAWQLKRHLRRKNPCVEIEKEPEPQTDEIIKCKFCCYPFTRKDNKKTHEDGCRMKDDYVRQLELRLDIDFEYNPLVCRFCDNEYKDRSGMYRHGPKCKAKEKYKKSLESRLKEKEVVQNVTNNYNNVNLYCDLRSFSQSNMEYFDDHPEVIARIIRQHQRPDQHLSIPRKYIQMKHMNMDLPENHNVRVTNPRSGVVHVYENNEWQEQNSQIFAKRIIKTALEQVTKKAANNKHISEDDPAVRTLARDLWKAEQGMRFVGDEIDPELILDFNVHTKKVNGGNQPLPSLEDKCKES